MPRTFDDCRHRRGRNRTRSHPRGDSRRRGGRAAFRRRRSVGPQYPWGTDYYFAHGRMAPADFLDPLARHDAILLGAVGHPKVQDHLTLNGLLLPIRRRFDQYVCLRPAYLYPGVHSPLRDKAPGSIDMLVFRENTEGEYAQRRRPALPGTRRRSGHPDCGLHAPRLRADHAGRLREGAHAPEAA